MAMTTMEHNVHMLFPNLMVQLEPFTPPPHSPLQSPPSIRHAHRYNHFFEDIKSDVEIEESDEEENGNDEVEDNDIVTTNGHNGEISVRRTRRVLFPVVNETNQN